MNVAPDWHNVYWLFVVVPLGLLRLAALVRRARARSYGRSGR